MFIKEGNAEILRLRTREHGEQQQRAQSLEAAPSHLSKEADSLTTGEELGKKMIMQRFIDGEGNEEQVSSINENLLSNNLLLTRLLHRGAAEEPPQSPGHRYSESPASSSTPAGTARARQPQPQPPHQVAHHRGEREPPESCANKHARKHKALHSSSSRSLTDLINSQRFREDTLLRGSERDLRSRVAKARAKELEESGLKKAQSCAEIHPEVLEKQLRTQDYIPKSLKARFLSRNRNCLETTGVDGKLRLKEKAQKEGADWQATGKRKDEQKAKVGATPVRSRSQLLKSTPAKNGPKSMGNGVLVKGSEDEIDSGIVMANHSKGPQNIVHKHQELLEKKSVFTIAYGDVETQQIQPDSSSSPP
ncbi:uncharacterized protein [Bemisia tabaci]|uniref:uncharacterized protein n=1 Tax=Bemisia tabaci TaxID=7038 RepID=UPI003B27C142